MASRGQRPLQVLSLFSGIGGLDLACEWAGMQVVGQVEIDPYCQQVLAKHWPAVKRVADVREVWGDTFESCIVVGGTLVLVGGFPCQPTSVAGKRRGALDDRWLWPEMLRVIQVYQPAWIVAENVPGLISKGLDGVLRDLGAAGYEAIPVVYPAAAIGAPHLRERVFIVAHSRCAGQQPRRIRGGSTPLGDVQHDGATDGGESMAHTQRERRERREGGATGSDEHAHECGRQEAATYPKAAGARAGGHVADSDQHSGRWQERAGAGSVGSATSSHASGEGHTQRHAAQRGGELANAGGTGRQGQEWTKSPVRGNAIRQGARCAQSRMGRAANELPGWMDCARFVAGPGQAQHEWEAPRTITGRIPNRASRLKALGNSVDPVQVYPILAAIAAVEAGA